MLQIESESLTKLHEKESEASSKIKSLESRLRDQEKTIRDLHISATVLQTANPDLEEERTSFGLASESLIQTAPDPLSHTMALPQTDLSQSTVHRTETRLEIELKRNGALE